jgi:hypothetical protein
MNDRFFVVTFVSLCGFSLTILQDNRTTSSARASKSKQPPSLGHVYAFPFCFVLLPFDFESVMLRAAPLSCAFRKSVLNRIYDESILRTFWRTGRDPGR